MGSFSWLRADRLTKTANIYEGCPFKFLIPEIYGGGFIKDHYQDYGDLTDSKNRYKNYDMYELLAFWNHETKYYDGPTIGDKLQWKGKEQGEHMPFMKEVDEFTGDNRHYGIEIGCYDNQIKRLKYPLKLISVRNNQTYEECTGISLGDPYQGFFKVSWEDIDKELEERAKSYEESIKRQVAQEVEIQVKAMGSIPEIDINSDESKNFIKEYAAHIEKNIRSRYE